MRNIHKSTPPSFRRRENAAAIVKAPPPGALTKGSDRKFLGLHPSPGGATSPSLSTNRRFAFPILALLAVLAVGLLFLLPGSLLQAQDDGTMEYAENGTDPVATYTGIDPEGRPIYWSLAKMVPAEATGEDIEDEDHFMISSGGVLSFKVSPDYEMPRGTPASDADNNNTYKVVVVASDDALGVTGRDNTYKKVTVTVTDVDEDGSISLSAQQPQVGVVLTAMLADQDASTAQISAAKWKWEQSSAMDGPWIVIVGTTDAAYNTVAGGVVDKYLRATATYTDEHGDEKTAMAVSAHAVRAEPSGTNSAPAFDPTDADGAERSVKENSPPGTNVGKPVTAADAPGDILTYMITADVGANYRIDPATGQITVGPRTILNREAIAEYEVQVTATDPWGLSTPTATVKIGIKNVNEAPTINGGPTKITHDEGSTGIDLDTSTTDVDSPTYMATDQESIDGVDQLCTSTSTGSTCAWLLSGADASDFYIGNQEEEGAIPGVLSFKKAPNFESPADADMDNMYMVTVVATDSGTPKMTATRDVVITVTNEDDMGTLTLSSVQPKVGIDFTATLTDEDNGVKDVKWQWYDGAITEGALTENAIDKAKSATYTPVTGDVNDILSVRATYTDNHGSGKSAVAVSGNVVVVDLENRAPEFKDTNDKVITSDTRSIAENSAADVSVVGPVTAIDPNGASGTPEGTLTYTLGGSDKSSFAISSNDGQITVKAGTKLDYEGKKVYRVTVKATDPSQASATIDITINVTDGDEPPVIAGEEEIVREFVENSPSTVHTFRATDPERRSVYWSLSDVSADNEDVLQFSISSNGALSFKEAPDFENPSDTEMENVYKVIVEASDDAPGAGTSMVSMKKVTVSVTNKSESKSITINRVVPQVDFTISATLTDGDATASEISAATWQWYSGSTVITDEIGATHIPTAAGTLKVVATYNAKGNTRTATRTGINVRTAPDSNGPPEFLGLGSTAERSVDENKRAGTSVGNPIVATDPNRDRLTYTLTGTNVSSFDIDSIGRLSTTEPLDHETENGTRSVTVTATDPSDQTDTVDVTVNVNNINEAPTINTGPTRGSQDENMPITTEVDTYIASDPETDAADLVWSLTGADAGDFEISDDGVLTFKEVPDFEKPAASNNVYQVTVKVSDGKLSDTRDVTVTVTDMAEEGVVTLSSVQPKVAVELTASLEDSDGGVKDITWQWARSDSAGGTFADIDDATSATYTPVKDDAPPTPMFLRAMASYTDSQGEQTAMTVSDSAVIVNNDNRAPMFADTETGMRSVAEGMADQNIGDPVAATDPNNNENLTYTLSGSDAASFDIDRVTGQLKTKAKLDYEAKNTYMVTVTAADPNGLSDTIDVTIMVTDVDEAPKIIVAGLVVRGTSDINYAENGTGMVTTYGAAGPDAANTTWNLSGADAGALRISSAGVLTFSASPNYESPADANTDNIYMVMVNANDGTTDAMKAVTVRVTNVEEMGRVTFWRDGAEATTAAIVVGDELGGAVDDSDGNPNDTFPIAMYTRIANVTSWQWAKTMTPAMMDSWMDITGATDAAYMVMDADEGYHLRVTAMYDDGEGMSKMASEKTMMVTMNASPMFDSETAERMVPENTAAGENVGDPVTAMDADNDTLTYGLSGTDMASFDIGSATGQLMTKAALDYEAKASYEVTVTATDPDSASDMITVTITVTNVEEPGTVTLWANATDALTMAPQVGDTITGAVMDPDDGVTGESWQWAKTMTPDMMDSWMDIQDATDAAYMVLEGDTGYQLRVMATYTDAVGTDTAMVHSPATMMVTTMMTVPIPLLVEYDPDGDGVIEKADMRRAVGNFFVSGTLSRDEMRRLVGIYFSSSS